jgi:L-lactate dehydrogenase complex protein LldE
VAGKQIELFSESYPIVVPSGSCAGMMRHHYPKLFDGDPDIDRIINFSQRIFELSEFLVHVLNIKLQDRGDPIKVTWHSSCHALREMRTTEDSKSLIRQLKNVDLIELQNETDCCGFGGTFAVKQPAISAAMVKDKTDDIRQTGAARLITGDCGCLMNISGAMHHDKIRIGGQHLAEFIWERINDQPSPA